jgi:uncharacterized membrane protein
MSVIKDVKQPETPPTGMAAKYERAYNEVVAEQPAWKKKIIINNFEMVSGHMTYPSRTDRDMVHDVMQQVVLRAENDY